MPLTGTALCDVNDEAVAKSEGRILQGLIFPVGVDLAGPDSGVLDQDMRCGLRAPLKQVRSGDSFSKGRGGRVLLTSVARSLVCLVSRKSSGGPGSKCRSSQRLMVRCHSLCASAESEFRTEEEEAATDFGLESRAGSEAA